MSNQIFYISGNKKFYLNENSGILALNNIIPTINGSGVSLRGEATVLPSTIVYRSGNQVISGFKTFTSRPTVNGTGVLLSGEAAVLPATIVYTTGNQTISGSKTFSSPIVFSSGQNDQTHFGGAGGSIDLRGGTDPYEGGAGIGGSISLVGAEDHCTAGSLISNAGGGTDANGGTLNMSGGSDSNGGSINTTGGTYDNDGGSIDTSGGANGAGGSINTSDGGGSIDTQGVYIGGEAFGLSNGAKLRKGTTDAGGNKGIALECTVPDEESGLVIGGMFFVRDGTFNNKPKYKKEDENNFAISYGVAPYPNASAQRWFASGADDFVAVAGNEAYPWLATWTGLTTSKQSSDYELKWEAGRLYTMQQNGTTIRSVEHCMSAPVSSDDETKGYAVGTRWVMDSGTTYVCTIATEENAEWELKFSQENGTGTGGYIKTSGDEIGQFGGYIDTSATNGGSSGGNIDTRGRDGAGGSINTSGSDTGGGTAGGSINTSAGATGDGGGINTSNGGGSINTRGVGSIQLGVAGTRTTLNGSASSDKTITLPNANGTVALTSDPRFTDSRTPTSHIHGRISSDGRVNMGGNIISATFVGTPPTLLQLPINASYIVIQPNTELLPAGNNGRLTRTGLNTLVVSDLNDPENPDLFYDGSSYRNGLATINGYQVNLVVNENNQNKPIKTDAAGFLAAGDWGTTANSFCQGNDPRLSNIVYTTGNQSISGVKTFATRPTVNGTGVLLSGETMVLPATIVYTSGDQNISGIKTFATRPTVNNTGILLSGQNCFIINLFNTSDTQAAGHNYFGTLSMGFSPLQNSRKFPILESCLVKKASWSQVHGGVGIPVLNSTGYFINTTTNITGIISTTISSTSVPTNYTTEFSPPIAISAGDSIVCSLFGPSYTGVFPSATRNSVNLYCYN